MAKLIRYKCTNSEGRDFYSGRYDYATALLEGKPIVEPDTEPPTGEVCGKGIHTSPTARKTIRFADQTQQPWRWFEGEVDEADVVEEDEQKTRSREFWPKRELFLEDIFGADFTERIERVRREVESWKEIPWLRPIKTVTQEEIENLISEWREALIPWMAPTAKPLPTTVTVVRTVVVVVAAAADADAADADAAAADADAAAADVAAAADAAAAAADAAAADVAAAVADSAADVADSAAAFASIPHRWIVGSSCWYARPYYTLRKYAIWELTGMKEPNPWSPFTKLYRMGSMPTGFVEGKGFVVYCPSPR